MSLSELHQAFVARRISRGAFIHRLVGLGMSLPIARLYALELEEVVAAPAPARRKKGAHDDFCKQHRKFCRDHCREKPNSPLCKKGDDDGE